MKQLNIVLIAIWGFCVTSCHDLSLEPKGILGESELFGSEVGIRRYFTGLYGYLPIEDFVYFGVGRNTGGENDGYRPNNYWEAMKFRLQNSCGEFVNTWASVNNNGREYWPYNRIREVNTFIANFPKYKDFHTDKVYNNLLGEAHFLRAFFYSGLAKRYGGIPIIKEVQSPLDPPETLEVSRATEYDTWKFIYEDLKFAIDNMLPPDNRNFDASTRANKYTAAALMNRMMLYAGSIAKYSGSMNFNLTELAAQQGFAGISPDKANEFFQYSYDAGKVVESGGYTLYTANYPDKATNFANLFLDRNSSENIFIKCYGINSPGDLRLRHTWDSGMCPNPDMSNFVGSQSYPALDVMRLYDFPNIVEADGKPIRFEKRSDIKTEMEPRMLGCMYFDGDQLRGKTFSIQRGLYKTFAGFTATDAKDGDNDGPANGNTDGGSQNRVLSYDRFSTYNYNGKAVRIQGDHGMRENEGGENNCLTGAFVRKYVNPNLPASETRDYGSEQHWIVFRLGEVYVNMAEACYELGKQTEAFDYIEKIRVRAGCKVTRPADNLTVNTTYRYPIDGNLQFIRDERYRELWGENHRWWDLRRWFIADQVLNRYIPRILSAYYVLDEDKYIFLDEHEKSNRNWTANRNCFYEGIPQGEINKNNNLLPQNPLR